MGPQSPNSPEADRPRRAAHLLSFDVEEYFQVEAAAAGVPREDWDSLGKRLAPCVRKLLDLLEENRATATFFVLGWVALRQPQLVRSIAHAGHEIASHGMDHRMLCRMTAGEFRRDLADSRKALEDISGRPVIGYRAPTFSITRETSWALDVLAESGFRYDSSIFPIRHDRYGVPDAPRFVFRAAGPGGGEILEFPPATLRFAHVNWPVGGGGYLRLLPVRLVARGLTAARRRALPGMIYLHPWEMDPDQPVLPMGWWARRRHRLGLARTEGKLRWLLRHFAFGSVQEALPALTACDSLQSYRFPAQPGEGQAGSPQ